MLMEAFDDDGTYITEAFVVCDYKQIHPGHIRGYVIGMKGRRSGMFHTYVSELLEKQQEMGFRIINRSGQCLPFLGDNT
jgi:hypothetical protein